MNKFKDNDEFWSLDSMLPSSAFQKKTVNTANDVTSIEIEIDGDEQSASSSVPGSTDIKYPTLSASEGAKIDFGEWLKKREKFVSDSTKSTRTVENEYVPKNPLIYKVTVTSEATKRRLNERFLSDGEAIYDHDGPFNGNEPYYAIFPQYASLNEAQKACYIGFRTCVREGAFPSVDEGYILLLVYELINLTKKSTPTERASTLAALICAYSTVSDKLFADMCNYLADICLIYSLPIPEAIFGEVYPRVLKSARIKEFFIRSGGSSEACSLLASVGRYDYRTSKFYGENKEYYDKYIEKAVALAIAHISKTDSRFREDKNDCCRLEHESFYGAYRTEGARKHIIMELACITRDEEVKRVVSELAKYAENCLRSALGIKPRLTVSYVNREIKDIIKRFIAENTASIAPVIRKTEKASVEHSVPDYEKMYEPKSEAFSFEDAERIEESSWGVTEKLVTAFDTEEDDVTFIAPVNEQKPQTKLTDGDPIMKGLSAISRADASELDAVARAYGMLTAALVDKINEMLLEKIGDIGIESGENGYTIAEWYIEDINELLKESNYGG